MKTAWIDCYGVVRVRDNQMFPDEKKVYLITPEELEEHVKKLAATFEPNFEGSEV